MCLKDKEDVDSRLFDHFRVQIAKWRFETIPAVQKELLPLRAVCRHHLSEEMFTNAQDKNKIQEVLVAARDEEMWCWTSASYRFVFEPCERARRWGLVCMCEEHQRLRRDEGKKHISCFSTVVACRRCPSF